MHSNTNVWHAQLQTFLLFGPITAISQITTQHNNFKGTTRHNNFKAQRGTTTLKAQHSKTALKAQQKHNTILNIRFRVGMDFGVSAHGFLKLVREHHASSQHDTRMSNGLTCERATLRPDWQKPCLWKPHAPSVARERDTWSTFTYRGRSQWHPSWHWDRHNLPSCISNFFKYQICHLIYPHRKHK